MDIERDLVVGRENADLTIDDSELSRNHAVIRPVEGGVEIEDLNSLNGTRVDGQRITTAVTLIASGTIKVGKSELLVEVDLPEITHVAEAPEKPLADIPGALDATVQRESPTPQPDVTAPRPLAGAEERPLDVTAQRRSPPPPVIVPPPEATPPDTEPESPAEAPPATEPPPAPAARAPGPPRKRGPTIALVIAGAFVLLVVVLLAIANSGGSSSDHVLNARARVATVSRSGTDALLAGVQSGEPTGGGSITMDLHFRPGGATLAAVRSSEGSAARVRAAGWTCFTAAGDSLLHCAPPGTFERRPRTVQFVDFHTSGATFAGMELAIRRDVYRGQKCRFEGGSRFHDASRGYVACRQFTLAGAGAGTTGPGGQLHRAGWQCFPISSERLLHCSPPGALQRGDPEVRLVVFTPNGKTFIGTEDMFRPDVYAGQPCSFEGGGLYHQTPRVYVACHEYALETGLTKISGRISHRFDDGSMTSVIEGVETPRSAGTFAITGTGRFTGGTKTYDGASGRYRLTGTIGPTGQATFTLKGNVKY